MTLRHNIVIGALLLATCLNNTKIALIMSSDIIGETSIVRKLIKHPADASAKVLAAKNS